MIHCMIWYCMWEYDIVHESYGLIDVQRDVTSENEEMKINTNILDNNNSNNV